MNAGRIEQIGTPEEVYGRPQTTFVAGFIGSPPMNLVAVQAEGGHARIGDHRLALPARAPRDGALLLGLRPEHAEPATADTGWPFVVDLVEMLGAERLVYGQLAGAPFTWRIDGTLPPPRRGETLHLKAAAERLHWFDPADGRRVEG
jgi:sn-glycerol 3-phosphate transport system ATP-binding protein